MSTEPMYRSLSVERAVHADRNAVFTAAATRVDPADEVLSHEPPWRLVTRHADAEVDLYEITVAIVETPDQTTVFSVSAVLGPEKREGALDDRLETVRAELGAMADELAFATDTDPEPGG